MEDGHREKYHVSSVIHDFVFLSLKMGCIRCIVCRFIMKGIIIMTLGLEVI